MGVVALSWRRSYSFQRPNFQPTVPLRLHGLRPPAAQGPMLAFTRAHHSNPSAANISPLLSPLLLRGEHAGESVV